MAEKKWFYYVHEEGNVLAKLNSDAFEWRLSEMGFEPCTYKKYLETRKAIREREKKINIEGMKEWPQTDIQQ